MSEFLSLFCWREPIGIWNGMDNKIKKPKKGFYFILLYFQIFMRRKKRAEKKNLFV